MKKGVIFMEHPFPIYQFCKLNHLAAVTETGLKFKKYSSGNCCGSKKSILIGILPKEMKGSMLCEQIRQDVIVLPLL